MRSQQPKEIFVELHHNTNYRSSHSYIIYKHTTHENHNPCKIKKITYENTGYCILRMMKGISSLEFSPRAYKTENNDCMKHP